MLDSCKIRTFSKNNFILYEPFDTDNKDKILHNDYCRTVRQLDERLKSFVRQVNGWVNIEQDHLPGTPINITLLPADGYQNSQRTVKDIRSSIRAMVQNLLENFNINRKI